MHSIHLTTTDPALNLACEEHFLRNLNHNYFLVWINRPCVIAGRHQNIYKEINYPYTRKHNIAVYRRISGGGTVYQDEGNINFSFIGNKSKNVLNYENMLSPILEALRNLNLDVQFDGRNGILLNNTWKISGNAQHAYKNRLLHHGTLLFSTNLEHLHHSLNAPHSYHDKAINSVKSQVSNIKDQLDSQLDKWEFITHLFQIINGTAPHRFTRINKKEIFQLLQHKYTNWEWNFGASPDYTFERSFTYRNTRFNMFIQVQKGILTEVAFQPSHLPEIKTLHKILINSPHEENKIYNKMKINLLQENLKKAVMDQLF